MKITLETTNGIYTVEPKQSFEAISEIIEYMVIPVLLAAGFSQPLINKYIGGEDD